jgi:hypothetical protein
MLISSLTIGMTGGTKNFALAFSMGNLDRLLVRLHYTPVFSIFKNVLLPFSNDIYKRIFSLVIVSFVLRQ